MRRAPLALVILALPALAAAQEPPKPTIDQLIERIGEVRKQRADLDRREAEAVAELRAQFKSLHDRIDALGLSGPGPKPPPPAPNPLRDKLKAAFDSDPAQLDKRRDQAKDLAALYRQAAVLAADETVPTAGALFQRVKDAAGALVGPDALREVRRAVAGELAALLPTDDALTADQRRAAAALFTKLALTLEEISK
jgi:hypothetical protein